MKYILDWLMARYCCVCGTKMIAHTTGWYCPMCNLTYKIGETNEHYGCSGRIADGCSGSTDVSVMFDFVRTGETK